MRCVWPTPTGTRRRSGSVGCWLPSTSASASSWPQLGEKTGIPFGTAHGLARPYVQRDESP
ncbi:hypothetical protein [Pseudonocardia sp. NPDC049635]|uniref:hypothetical protein n=1 Tax=Pseudonocardia sp. NPDC049635 TaxID=3155506 RepID=UPI0033D8573B